MSRKSDFKIRAKVLVGSEDGQVLTWKDDAAEWGEGGSGSCDLELYNGEGKESIRTKSSKAIGHYSFAEGYETETRGEASHSEGYHTKAYGAYSHSEGIDTYSTGDVSHAEGYYTEACGNYSHSEGFSSYANGEASHSEGYYTEAYGAYSHSEGYGSYANGEASHAEGYYTATMNGKILGYSHILEDITSIYGIKVAKITLPVSNCGISIEGDTKPVRNIFRVSQYTDYTVLYGNGSCDIKAGARIVFIQDTWNEFTSAHAEGNNTLAVKSNAHAEGKSTIAYINAHAEGNCSYALGENSHSEGTSTLAKGNSSHAEGHKTTAFGCYSHAEGCNVTSASLVPESYLDVLEDTTTTTIKVSYSYYTKKGTTVFIKGDKYGLREVTNVKQYTDADTTEEWYNIINVSGPSFENEIYKGAQVIAFEKYSNENDKYASHAEGCETNALGFSSHAEGYNTFALKYAHAEGSGCEACGDGSHAEGEDTKAMGYCSHTEGYGCKAADSYSHAEGYISEADGYCSHAEGYKSIAKGKYAHAEGYRSSAESDCAHAEGYECKAKAKYAHAEGNRTEASGEGSHAEGSANALGNYAHAEGYGSLAFGWGSHAEGEMSEANGSGSHSEGSSDANGNYSHAEGEGTKSNGKASHSEGDYTIANGIASHSEGYFTNTHSNYDHAEGYYTNAAGIASHAQGKFSSTGKENLIGISYIKKVEEYDPSNPNSKYLYITIDKSFTLRSNEFMTIPTLSHERSENLTASDLGTTYKLMVPKMVSQDFEKVLPVGTPIVFTKNSQKEVIATHAEGLCTMARGNYSHAEGFGTITHEESAHSEGFGTIAKGKYSHSQGYRSEANGSSSHAGGYHCNAIGNMSFAMGNTSTAAKENSCAIGNYVTAYEPNQFVTGTYNAINSDALFVVGNGTSAARSNAFRINNAGAVFSKGAYNTSGADYAEMFEWSDGNLNNESRLGYFVTFDAESEKIRIANNEDDYILGVVSSATAIIGDNYDQHWKGKYLTDKWGNIQYQEVNKAEVSDERGEILEPARIVKDPMLNPNYDSSKEYIPRTERREWSPIGLLGKLYVYDDGTCKVGGYCKPNENGIATNSDTGYRVIAKENGLVKILFK